MKSSCFNNPANEPLIIIRHWQLEFCDGNYVAAAVLSFFGYFHTVKTEIQTKNIHANKVAVKHGEEATHDTSLLQFHTLDEIRARIMNIAKIDRIRSAIQLLVNKKALTVHKNPNPRYSFDKTNFYLLHPDICNGWLAVRGYSSSVSESTDEENEANDEKPQDITDDRKIGDRGSKNQSIDSRNIGDRTPENPRRAPINPRPSPKNRSTITKTTTKTTSKTPVINQPECIDEKTKAELTELEGNIQTCLLGRGFIQQYCTTKGLSALAALVTAGDYSVKQIGELFTDILRRKAADEIQLNYLVTILTNKLSAQSSHSQPGEASIANTSSGLNVIDALGEEGA